MYQGDARDQIADQRSKIERALDFYLSHENSPKGQVAEAARYMVCGKAHRWRAILAILATKTFGGSVDIALPTACAIEFAHTSSIILDDLPCMDNASLRRGRAACHLKFGEATSILASIHLLNLALKLIPCEQVRTYLSSAIARMIRGQAYDLGNAGAPISREQVLKTYALKSGALYGCAVQSGAILAGVKTRRSLSSLRRYGVNIGVAYQILDDIYDWEGAEDSQGKNVRMDIGKATYVSIFGCEVARSAARYHRERAVEFIAQLGSRSAPLKQVAIHIAPIEPEEVLRI